MNRDLLADQADMYVPPTYGQGGGCSIVSVAFGIVIGLAVAVLVAQLVIWVASW